MKSNHIPVDQRLKNRIHNLEMKLGDETEPIGGSNPYYKCIGCGRSVPQISIDGHLSGCRIVGIKKEIKHYKKILDNL